MEIDPLDQAIVQSLRKDARQSVRTLAQAVQLSPSATGDRLRRLIESRVIVGFSVDIDPALVGRPLDALIDVQLVPGAPYSTIDDELIEMDQIVDAVHLTGQYDYQLRTRSRSVEDLESLIAWLKNTGVVQTTQTRIVLRSAKAMPRGVALR